VPIPVRGVYSDYHYRLHSCRAFAIPPAWLSSTGTVDRVPVKYMTIERFSENYENRIALSLSKVADGTLRWQDPAYLIQHGKGLPFVLPVRCLPADFALPAYYTIANLRVLRRLHSISLIGRYLGPGSHLWNDYMPDLQKSCPYWDPKRRAETGHDLFDILGEGQRPDHRSLLAHSGAARSFTLTRTRRILERCHLRTQAMSLSSPPEFHPESSQPMATK
jgi:hypothetical protein